MARWEPDAPGRLELAALELFAERGYDRTTVADIAEAAGVTKRTFFRHYADKREVLFGGSETFRQSFVDGVSAVPSAATPMEALSQTLLAVAASFGDRADWSRRRHAVIDANPELRERELVKLASVAAAVAGVLRERGASALEAGLAADAGMAAFANAYGRWAATPGSDLPRLVQESLDALRSVTAS